VPYRYDAEQKKRFRTVELIVEAVAWEPKARHLTGDTLVKIRVGLPEAEVRRQVKRAGGQVECQEVCLGAAVRLGGRIMVARTDCGGAREDSPRGRFDACWRARQQAME
jgi:hypothetical protein